MLVFNKKTLKIVLVVIIGLFLIGALIYKNIQTSIEVENFDFEKVSDVKEGDLEELFVSNSDSWKQKEPYFWGSDYYKDYDKERIFFKTSSGKSVDKNDPKGGRIYEGYVMSVDYETFEIVGEDIHQQYPREAISYAKDKNNVYCNHVLNPQMDPETISIKKVNNNPNDSLTEYVYDKNNIYINCKKIEGVDRDSLEFISAYTFTDKNGVYYFGKKIEGVDRTSVKFLENSSYFLDKNKIYYNDDYLEGSDSEDFLEIFPGKMVSNGNLYFGSEKVGTSNYEITNTSTGNLFISGNDFFFEEIGIDDKKSTHLISNEQLQFSSIDLGVYRNKIYFYNEKSGLSVFSPLDNSVEEIIFDNIDTLFDHHEHNKDILRTRINDFFISGDDLYFLYGKNCTEYKESCNLEIYKHHLPSGKTAPFGIKVSGHTLYALEDGRIVIHSSFGDGGEWSFSYRIFDLNNSTEHSVGVYSGTNYETEGDIEEVEKLEKEIKDVVDYFEIHFENGVMLRKEKEDDQYGNSGIREYRHFLN
ncbi:DKNYY domain-containing protein [Candidatus Pacebacteria bacterium]|nr:DKNYY domain-containing protein [Candidatus Paceibacterota bacterium]